MNSFIGKHWLSPHLTWIGRGRLLDLATHIKSKGPGLIVHGASFCKKSQFKELQKRVDQQSYFYLYEGGEPTLEDVLQLIAYTKKKKALWLAGIGGGSVLDVTKAAAGLYHAEKDLSTYQHGAVLERTGLPFFATPTTAGTGSEATMVTVLTNEKTLEKIPIRHPSFLAELAILDAELLSGCSAEQIAFSGFDALTHSLESYVSTGASVFTRTLAVNAFIRIMESLAPVYLLARRGWEEQSEAVDTLLEASYMAGMAFTNSGLGVVHGLTLPLGAQYKIPHGHLCALSLPLSIELNKTAMGEDYMVLSQGIGSDLLERLKGLQKALGITNPLRNQTNPSRENMIEFVLETNSTRSNVKMITHDDVDWLLDHLFIG